MTIILHHFYSMEAVYRPWGYFEYLFSTDTYQVKRICIKPGCRLSLQYHNHRSEHWTVVQGTGSVQVDDNIYTLTSEEYINIPCGSQHRATNIGDDWFIFIEVQIGDYLGEDDIVRIEDDYGRIE